MANISVLGLGSMGSALAAALQRADHRLCVWNRTAAKMERFVEGGADGAPSAAAAIRASPVVMVCVDDYRVTREILEGDGAGAELANRTLVQVSTGEGADELVTPGTHGGVV